MFLPLLSCWSCSKPLEIRALYESGLRFLRLLFPVLLLLGIAFPAGADGFFPESAPPALIQLQRLPIDLASETAEFALDQCRKRGAEVSVSLVDHEGILQVYMHGDHAAPHTAQLSRHKAYTAVSLAALQGWTTTGELAAALRTSKAAIGALPLPADSVDAITPIPGGVVLRLGSQTMGGLGVSGAREGTVDEDCARDAAKWLEQALQQP